MVRQLRLRRRLTPGTKARVCRALHCRGPLCRKTTSRISHKRAWCQFRRDRPASAAYYNPRVVRRDDAGARALASHRSTSAGASPASVSIGAPSPSSRPQARGETLAAQAGVKSLYVLSMERPPRLGIAPALQGGRPPSLATWARRRGEPSPRSRPVRGGRRYTGRCRLGAGVPVVADRGLTCRTFPRHRARTARKARVRCR